MIKKSLIIAFVLLTMILTFSNSVQSLDKSKVVRGFSLTTVAQGDKINVTLDVTIIDGETFYVIEEYIPAEWTVIDDGVGATDNPNVLKWIVISNAVDTTYTYTIQAPSTIGDYDFNGIYMFEDFNNSATTLGDTQISVTTSNSGGSGGGGSSSSGGGISNSISLVSAQTDENNDTINLNESQEEINSRITGGVIGFAKSGFGKGLIFTFLIIITGVIVITKKKRESYNY